MLNYADLLEALTQLDFPVADEAFAKQPMGDYAVATCDRTARVLWGDDEQVARIFQGTVDLFCDDAGKSKAGMVEQVLRQHTLAWNMNFTTYDASARIMHTQWVFEVLDDGAV